MIIYGYIKINITMTPEENFNDSIIWVLKQLKKESLFGGGISIKVDSLFEIDDAAPPKRIQLKVLDKLRDMGAISHNYYGNLILTNNESNLIYIEILQPKFDEVYSKYITIPQLSFEPGGSLLSFQNKSILISKKRNSDAHYLLTILFGKTNEVFAYDQIWENEYFKRPEAYYDKTKDWRKIYNACRLVNKKVAEETTIKDFLNYNKTEVSINKKYLPS